MSLSKPIYNLAGFYFESLYNRPVLTKSCTAAVLGLAANYVSQRLDANTTEIDTNALAAYGLFGFLFGGSVPHYFYGFVERLTREWKNRRYWQFVLQRLIFTPAFTALNLYCLALFEYASRKAATKNLMLMYKKVLLANWKYLSLPIFLNFKYVPPMMRVLMTNIIGVFWIIYLANKRRMAKRKADEEKSRRLN